jgi:hypothetical protein
MGGPRSPRSGVGRPSAPQSAGLRRLPASSASQGRRYWELPARLIRTDPRQLSTNGCGDEWPLSERGGGAHDCDTDGSPHGRPPCYSHGRGVCIGSTGVSGSGGVAVTGNRSQFSCRPATLGEGAMMAVALPIIAAFAPVAPLAFGRLANCTPPQQTTSTTRCLRTSIQPPGFPVSTGAGLTL